jgi:hypothetical protein
METLSVCPHYNIDKSTLEISRKDNNWVVSKTPTRNGYVVKINMSIKGGQQKGYLLTRLIATQWIPNPNNWEFVKYKDENKLNIDIDNLYWAQNKNQSFKDAEFNSRKLEEYRKNNRDVDED